MLVGVSVGVGVLLAVTEGVGVLLPVCVDVEDVVPEDVAIALAEAEDVTVPDIEGVFVGAALPETDIDAVKLGEELDELVGLLEIV